MGTLSGTTLVESWVSIKNKKTRTSNAYRLKKIEDRLISEGYVCISYIEGKKGTRRWVDCVEAGYDISYNSSADEIPDLDGHNAWVAMGDNFFYIHVEQGASGSADTVEGAIANSRNRYF